MWHTDDDDSGERVPLVVWTDGDTHAASADTIVPQHTGTRPPQSESMSRFPVCSCS